MPPGLGARCRLARLLMFRRSGTRLTRIKTFPYQESPVQPVLKNVSSQNPQERPQIQALQASGNS